MMQLRLASTLDPRDYVLALAQGSCHYMNVHDDSGWFGSDESPEELLCSQEPAALLH